VLGAWGAPQRKKGKGKAKAGSGAGGGPSTKAAAAAGSSGEGSSSQGSSRPSTLPPGTGSAAPRSTLEAVLPSAKAVSGAQKPAGGGKKEMERQRKERQRQRRLEEAREALQVAMEAMALGARCGSPLWLMCLGRSVVDVPRQVPSGSVLLQVEGALTCGGVCGCSGESKLGAVEEATAEAEKHDGRSESLAALVAEARTMVEQARAAQARVASEEAAAAAAAEAAERLRLEEEEAGLTLSVQSDTLPR
jgi:hypothetical protein